MSYSRAQIYNYMRGANLYSMIKPYIQDYGERILGYRQYKNTQASLSAQMDYEQYLKGGNERALRDFHKNETGHRIAYPEFSYPGAIRRSDTSIATAGFSYDNAYSNFVGNLGSRAYRSFGHGAGLYSVPSGLYSRRL